MRTKVISPGWIKVIAAAVVPFAIVWVAMALWYRYNPPPRLATRVVNFSDYFTASFNENVPTLGQGKLLWQAPTGTAPDSLRGIEVIGGSVAILTDSRLVAVDPTSGRLSYDSGPNAEAIRALGASALVANREMKQLWVYGFQSGLLTFYPLQGGSETPKVWRLEQFLFSPRWLNERVVSSGLFESELLRVYEVGAAPKSDSSARASRVSPSVATRAAGVIGKPLFPGLDPLLAKQLNMTVVDVRPTGDKLAVGFKWADRIDIYDVPQLTLERSIAGPVLSKLDFAVGIDSGHPRFTVSDESRYSYMDLAVTKDAILALYAGREIRKHAGKAGVGSEIHVFTWDGRLSSRWRISGPVYAIALDTISETLYACLWQSPLAVVSIDVRQLLNGTNEAVRSGGG